MGVAALEGERFASQGSQGSMLLDDGAQAYANDWAFADRVDDTQGWVSHSPFTHGATMGQIGKFVNPQAATDDFSRVAWRTNNATIGIFPETLGWNSALNPTFLSTWDGRWEVFAPTVADPATAGQVPSSIGAGSGETCELAFSGDASRAVCSTQLLAGVSMPRGLGGAEDPTGTAYSDLVGGRSVYVAETTSLSDSFATGPRTLVNVCSAGTQIPSVDGSANLAGQGCPDAPGRADLISSRGATLNDTHVTFDDSGMRGTPENVISENGSRVFFMSPDPQAAGVPNGTSAFCTGTGASTVCPTQLFVRQDNGDGTFATRWISKAAGGLHGTQDASLTGTVRLERATPDGDKVFFRTNSPLTADDRNATGAAPVTTGSASDSSWDLYMYDLPDAPGADPGAGTLTRISAGPAGAADCNVQPGGSSPGVMASRVASADGSRVVFTCAAPLPGVPVSGNGTITEPGGTVATTDQTNLYSYDAGRPAAERHRFVARVPRAIVHGVANCAGAGPTFTTPLDGAIFLQTLTNCVRGTADGSFVTFWTAGRLTADDPDATSADIYAYDAVADELTRVTAPQGGVGGTYPCGTTGAAATQQCYGDNGYDFSENTSLRVAKPILGVATEPMAAGDRLAFFQSKSRLVAEDQNAVMDVYQWRNGELSLVSSGSASDTVGAYYRGNDKTGRNVYFVTPQALTWQDTDVVWDAYTARVGGGIVQPAVPVSCALAAACQSGASGAPAGVVSESARPVAGDETDAVVTPRGEVSLRALTAVQRSALARGRTVSLRVSVNQPGRIVVSGRARVGSKVRTVVSARRSAARAGTSGVPVRLSSAARRELASSGKALRVALSARFSEAAEPAVRSVRLRAAAAAKRRATTRGLGVWQ